MKRFLIFLILAMPLWLVAQPLEPYRHNFFTTNPAPVVQAVAGSNVFITYSTPGTATRTFLIDVPASGAATNVFRSEAGTNVVIVTNGFLYTISVPSFVNGTNGLNGTNGVNGINGTNGVNGINGTNGVNGVNGTNAAIFITNTITGSPGSSASVTNLGDSLNALFQFTIPAGINGTNGLNGANGTNGVDGINGTNGAPGINGTNAAVGLVTNEFTITPGLTTNGLQYLPLAGGTVNGPVLTTSGTTNGPSQNELATAGWVRGLFNVGADYYVTTVIDAVATNSNPGAGQPVYDFASTIPASTSRSYTTSDFLTNNGYMGSVVTTNSFMALGGTVAVNGYLGFTGGSSTPTLTIHPEIYYSYDRTNWFGDFSGGTQAIVHGTTNIYEWAINFPTLTATNSTGFYVQRRFKCDSVTGAGVRTFTILIGTNVLSGVNDATHVTMQSPSATSGDAFLAANQTFTGSNAFVNGGGTVTILGGNVTASGVVIGTNGLAPGSLTVATLPANPIAGQTCWASDVLTTRGTGDLVTWNGSKWINRENIPAVADMYAWILLVKSNSVAPFIYNRVCSILQVSDYPGSAYQPLINAQLTGTSGSVGSSDTPGVGVFMFLSTGTTFDGSARVNSYATTGSLSATETNAFGCSAYVGNACSGTESYWAYVGMDDQTGTNWVGANNGCGFAYDCYRTNITSAISNTWAFSSTWTNNWIAVCSKAGTAAYKDSLLPVSTSSSSLNRLLVTYSTSEIVFFTNGVPFWTNSTSTYIPVASPPRLMSCKIVKFLGATGRNLYLKDPMLLRRHAERDM